MVVREAASRPPERRRYTAATVPAAAPELASCTAYPKADERDRVYASGPERGAKEVCPLAEGAATMHVTGTNLAIAERLTKKDSAGSF
jgi:hypothetical protein